MRDFQETVNYCSLTDLGYQGPKFTWCNKRDEGLICKKLDRVLVNDTWCQKFPHSYDVFEAGGCSDHLRCRVMLQAAASRGKKPFKFVNVLTKLPQFKPAVESHWDKTTPLFVSTSALHRFCKKLKSLKPVLRSLGKEKLSDLPKRTHEAYKILCHQQAETLLNPSPSSNWRRTTSFPDMATSSWFGGRFLKAKIQATLAECGGQE